MLAADALWSAGAVVVVVVVVVVEGLAAAVVEELAAISLLVLDGAADALVLLADVSGVVDEADPDGAEPDAAQWSAIIFTSLT